jgi:hypothetical protein
MLMEIAALGDDFVTNCIGSPWRLAGCGLDQDRRCKREQTSLVGGS